MGLLRFLLACAVIIEHTSPVFGMTLTGATIAVQSFFMISGFYMALILNQKYLGAGSYSLFITNRFLKLFPIYWVVLAGVLVFMGYQWLRHGNLGVFSVWSDFALDWTSAIYLGLTNLLMFGQDLTLFLKFTPDMTLAFTADFRQAVPPVFRYLLIPPAWSLGIELTFYVMAPWLLRRSTVVLCVGMGISLALRYFAMAHMGLDHDPWTYRFFPFEIAFFLAGAIAFKAYAAISWGRIPNGLLWAAFGVILGLTLVGSHLNRWAFYGCFVLALPFIFRLTRTSVLDRHIGDLSYPMYISHLLVLWVLSDAGVFAGAAAEYRGVLTITGAALLSVGLAWITRPIENWRGRRVRTGSRPLPAAEPATTA